MTVSLPYGPSVPGDPQDAVHVALTLFSGRLKNMWVLHRGAPEVSWAWQVKAFSIRKLDHKESAPTGALVALRYA